MWRDRDPFDHARVYVDGILQDIDEQRQRAKLQAATLQPGDALKTRPSRARSSSQIPGMAPPPQLGGSKQPPTQTQDNDAEPFLLALNQTRCYAWTTSGSGSDVTFHHDSERYGAELRSLRDAPELGITIFRQLGDIDLTWTTLAFDPEALVEEAESGAGVSALKLSGIGLQVPHWRIIDGVTSRLSTGGPAVPDTAIVKTDTINDLVRLLAEAHNQGVKLILTFLHFGNGGAGYSSDVPDEVSDPSDYGTLDGSTEYTSASGRSTDDLDNTHRRLRWSSDHVGAAIKDPELPDTSYDFPQPVDDDAIDAPPHLEILDPWCPYKRMVIRKLASMAATLLSDVVDPMLADVLDGYTGLGDIIHGIELFNEVDHASSSIHDPGSTGFDMDATGQAWGRTCYHAAKGLRRVLPESTGIKILLPGLSSYQKSGGDDETWEGRLAFVEGLANGFAAEFRSRAEVLFDEGPDWTLDNIVDLFQGMDVHNYHFRDDAAGRPVHCGLLSFELQQIREAILAGLREPVRHDVDADEQVALFESLPLTVIETTTTAVGPGASDVCGSYKPSTTPWDTLSYDSFQAWELWRRLGSALGGNAAVAGWHSWMGGVDTETGSPLDTPFGGSGIRQDIDDDDLGTRRLSWTALGRLAHHLGRASSGRLVHPDVSGRDELIALAEAPAGPADRAVVFEFRVGSEAAPGSWYYLVLLDPSVEPDTAWTDGGLRILGAADGTGLASVEEHIFLGLRGGAGFTRAATTETRYLPLTLYVDVGGTNYHNLWRPRLYESTKQLSWEAWGDRTKLVGDAPEFVREPAVIGW